MPLPLPHLDDRRWADLVQEGRALIPRYAPRWTDHNIHDPGVTLVELFAWITEANLYWLNRITARHRGKFLSLIGFAPEAPRAARTMLAFDVPAGLAGIPFDLPGGVEFEGKSPHGALVPFRTLRGITVSDVKLTSVHTGNATTVIDVTNEWVNGLPLPLFGTDPQPAHVCYFGFTQIPAKKPVTLAFRWERPGADAFARGVQSGTERDRLIVERAAQQRACRPILPDIECPGAPPVLESPSTLPRHHSVRLVWETFTGTWTPLTPIAPGTVPAEGEIADDTRALTLDGIVEVNLPAAVAQTAVGSPATTAFYLRCRIVSGAYDAPPVLLDVYPNAVPAEQSVPLWQQLPIPLALAPATPPTPGKPTRFRATFDAAGALTSLAFLPTAAGLPDVMVVGYQAPAGAAAGHLTIEMVRIGRGNDAPDQTFSLPAHPIASDDALAVYSHDGTDWHRWTIRADFDASTRVDSHCTLDRTTGALTFGSGERGRVLPKDHAVLVTGRTTLAGAGAVRSGTVNAARASAKNQVLLGATAATLAKATTTNPWPAYGGADRESLAHATGRAAEALHVHARLLDLADEERTETFDQVDRVRVRALPAPSHGVNLLDLERLALDVPGTRVARARAWPHLRAEYPCLSAPGSVTLVVMPDMPVPRPQASAGLLRMVKRYLDRRRMVTTMLQVVGPRYLVVSVTAVVQSRQGANAASVRDRITRALDLFLDPRGGGPNNLGWPFGRDVYRAEIMQLIDGIAGVDHVLELSLAAPGAGPQCGNLTVCPTWLAAPGTHRITVE